jgi:photoactive yellow protein
MLAMPKVKGVKGAYKHFQLKLYGSEIDKWQAILWKAKERAIKRQIKVSDSDINRALLGMAGAKDWLVTEKERKYFQGMSKIDPFARAVQEDEHRAPPSRIIKQIARADDRCIFCGKSAKDRLCTEHRTALIGDPKMTREMLDDLAYGAIELDRDGKILAYNREESEMSRISHKRAIHKNFFTLAPCDEVKELHARYDEFLKGTDIPDFETTYSLPHGAVRVSISFVRVDENRALVVAKKVESRRGRKTG